MVRASNRVRYPASRPAMLRLGLLAFVVPAGVILASRGYKPLFDSADYARLGVSIANGHGYARGAFGPTAFRSPAYPVLLGVAFAISGESQIAGRLATAACGVAVVLLIYMITLRLSGRRAAGYAGVLAALFPPLVGLEVGFFSEPLFLVFELGAVFAVLRFVEHPRDWKLPIVAGALCGLAALSRDNGLLLVPVVALGVAMAPCSRRGRMAGAGAVLVVAAIVIAPWTVRNAVAFHRFVPVSTETGLTMIGILNARAEADDAEPFIPDEADIVRSSRNEADFDAKLTARALRYGLHHPLYTIKAVVLNTLRTLGLWTGRTTGFYSYSALGVRWSSPFPALTDLSIYPIYALALVGVAAMVRRRGRPPLVFWLAPLVLLLASGIAAGAARYRAPADPFFLILAGMGLAAIRQTALQTKSPRLKNGQRSA